MNAAIVYRHMHAQQEHQNSSSAPDISPVAPVSALTWATSSSLAHTSSSSAVHKQQQTAAKSRKQRSSRHRYSSLYDQTNLREQNKQPTSSRPSRYNAETDGHLMDKNKKLFPQRLWELIHDEKYNFCLRWSPDGQRVYLNRVDFENHYLKTPNNQFHTQKAISFVRQMNMYGFRKVDDCYYENDNFKRNCHHLLKNMVRRHANKAFFSASSNNPSTSSAIMTEQTNPNERPVSSSSNINNNCSSTSSSSSSSSSSRSSSSGSSSSNRSSSSNPHNNQPIDYQHTDEIQNQAILHHQQSLYCQQQLAADQNTGNRIGATRALDMNPRLAAHYAEADHGHLSTNTNFDSAASMAAAIHSDSARLPLASTLYQRLAAMNFGRAIGTNEQLMHHQQQAISDAAMQISIAHELQNHDIINARNQSQRTSLVQQQQQQQQQLQLQQLQQQQQLLQPQLDLVNIPMSPQQSLAARQALQQALLRSLLLLKQPHSPLNLQQNMLANMQQQNPNLLLESIANLNSAASSGLPADRMTRNLSPLELFVNPALSATSDQNQYQPQYLRRFSVDNSLLNQTTENSNNIMSPMSSSLVEERKNGDEEDCTIDFEDDLLNRNFSSAGTSSLSPSTQKSSHTTAQDADDSNNAVLDLAKPSNARSTLRHLRMSD